MIIVLFLVQEEMLAAFRGVQRILLIFSLVLNCTIGADTGCDDWTLNGNDVCCERCKPGTETLTDSNVLFCNLTRYLQLLWRYDFMIYHDLIYWNIENAKQRITYEWPSEGSFRSFWKCHEKGCGLALKGKSMNCSVIALRWLDHP